MGTFPDFMRLVRLSGITVAIALAATACAARLPPISLDGTQTDLAQLAGNWAGEYVGDSAFDPGGSILFSLQAGDERAYGDVLMTRRGANHAYERYDPEHPAGRSLGQAQSLSISIVRTKDGQVSGELEPYWDFDRERQAYTVFHGSVRGNVIEGTYETRFRGALIRRTGKWRVVRRP
jgi:hypothetical protein